MTEITEQQYLTLKAKDIFLNLGLEPREYSGRGMYGAYCLAVETDDRSSAPLIIDATEEMLNADYTKQDISDILIELKRVRTDNLGMGYIHYFPNLPWVE